MARLPRHVLPDGVYHVTTRGVDGVAIFRDDDDRLYFLRLLADVVPRAGWRSHAFCLMTNHYHLVVEALCAQLSYGMHRLNGIYAQRFNIRHTRRGHLFGDRFWSELIESESHFEAACAYVIDNPVRAGFCQDAASWPWSASRTDPRVSRILDA